jgi:hypothetical protein
MQKIFTKLFIGSFLFLVCFNAASANDGVAPEILDFDVAPTLLSTANGDAVITATMHLTDTTGVWAQGDPGGPVDTLNGTNVTFVNDYNEHGYIENFIRVSGTQTDGIYTADIRLPQGSSAGWWHLSYINVIDIDGNGNTRSQAEFEAAVPGASGLDFLNDIVAPQITEFAISPVTFNTESSSAVIDLSFRVSDADSGIWITGDPGNSTENFDISLESVIGDQTEFFGNYTRVSGTQNDGIYSAQVTVPISSITGPWNMPYARITDQAGNYTSYTKSELLSAVPAATGLDLENLSSTNSATVDFIWTLSLGNHFAILPGGLVITKNGGGNFILSDFGLNDFDASLRPALDGIVAKIKLGIDDVDLDFSSAATLSLDTGSVNNGKNMDVMFADKDDSSWSKLTTCTVSDSYCDFTTTRSGFFALVQSAAEVVVDSPAPNPFASSGISFSKKDVKSGKTSKSKIKLSFSNVPNATNFMISRNSDFSGAQWQTISSGVSIKFSKKAKRRYYVKFKDQSGTESTVFSKSVSYSPKVVRKISNSKSKVKNGEILIQQGRGFVKNGEVLLFFGKADKSYYKPVTIRTDKNGNFGINFKVNKTKGYYSWYAQEKVSGKKSQNIHYQVL